jgi:hypothetical protein
VWRLVERRPVGGEGVDAERVAVAGSGSAMPPLPADGAAIT